MPRLARLDAPGVLHHIMVPGIERRKIFLEDGDHDDGDLMEPKRDRLMEASWDHLLGDGPGISDRVEQAYGRFGCTIAGSGVRNPSLRRMRSRALPR